MPTGNRKYKISKVSKKVISSMQHGITGKMMMTQKEMDNKTRSNIKNKMM